MVETSDQTSGQPSARVELRGLGVRFGDVAAVDGVDLTLEPGSFTALLGPSGCGKSTTLGVVAGLGEDHEGDVLVDGASVRAAPPERRPVSLVFQKPLLFPHLTVAQNVGFGLRMAGVRRPVVRREVASMLERVRLDGLGDRRPGELSGGQEQRVSLARALVRRPRVLLLDEPFSQLDADLRSEMRTLVRELHDESGVTTLFVTHDREEAVEVADRIALMLAGRIEATGTPEEFYTRPGSRAAARFFGFENELRGVVAAGRFRAANGTVEVAPGQMAPGHVARGAGAPEGRAVLVVRPESLRLGAAGAPAEVKDTRFAGTHVVVDLALDDGQRLRAHVPVGAAPEPGSATAVRLPPERCTVLGETGLEDG